MAVENESKKYYKINFKRCSVVGYDIFVDYSVYNNIEERNKEKVREPEFNIFFNKLKERITFLYDIYYKHIEENNIITTEQLESSPVAQEVILPDELDFLLSELNKYFYNINNIEKEVLNISQEAMAEIIALGFKQEWINDPICYTGGGCLNCGEYKDEIISYSFYYNKLKEMMPDAVLYDV